MNCAPFPLPSPFIAADVFEYLLLLALHLKPQYQLPGESVARYVNQKL